MVLFDHVGAGRSDLSAWSEDRYSGMDGYVDDVLEICRELNLGPVTFVGHSVSAMMGVLAAARHPEYFAGLVLLAPSPASSTIPRPGTAAGSAPRTSRNCCSPWTRTIWAGQGRWHRSSWATPSARNWGRS
ncbi:alpha/beta fold hydrolase [Streptomyces nogalater]